MNFSGIRGGTHNLYRHGVLDISLMQNQLLLTTSYTDQYLPGTRIGANSRNLSLGSGEIIPVLIRSSC